ncbi:gliding motility-associated ABC transporter substrate-binding protein GldG [Tenacibaculum finnmarkense]|uniref:Gliding motility-associated ABC transporter substrate-binding protein GldG n=1 Tax=Tenacibaculum finnmarkense genomovar finnmarkense TaxID=1458503 RepID=A0AAP1RFK3_9FLAO|nr:gliding motility-associated ABC transporter substrate-binding protein GldG [Tenacibaculum finnmarkense]MBE7653100.1 gliding motility-associated ABC transporter substrate-binding protein GldG [Tenacibaculum finnmarkense genomovar finnmarkense]MBE7695401.1 gliding motility-associated ABC transporter substrate-binding protein GldG [Tenacibaculum finnmarkense genomovar finnmarkense]MCD8427455.1 gliding motility-associated ABC transporter substrate-binding protein GldG [Tenacibaculum finnmarkense 
MNKKLQYSAFAFFGLLLINYLSNSVYKRFDLTQDNRYTISKTSINLLDKLENIIFINVYLEGDFPAEFKRLQTETRQFLEELKALNSNVQFRFINPNNIREKLIKKGMMPSQLTVEEDGKLSEAIIFPWAEISSGQKTELVSLLPNTIAKTQEKQLQNAIEKLEYSFANAINNITRNQKQKIAVIAGNGELEDIDVYSLLTEISQKYRLAKFTLDSVAKNPQKTLSDLTKYDLAIIAKPTERFTEQEKFTLDQFISNGGKTLWMLDTNYADTDSLYNNGKMLAFPRDLNLTDLLFSYQVRVNNTLIQDLYSAKIPLATGNTGNQAQFKHLNWFYHPLVNGNPNHPITKNIAPVRFRFTTQIDTLKGHIKKTPLFVTSLLTKKIGTPNFVALQSIAKQPKEKQYNSGRQLLAVLLEGDFNSAYKNRTKPFNTPLFKAKSTANKMVVIADGDVARNQILKGKPHDLALDKWTGEQFGNKEFLINTIDYLLDDTGLINLRNKTVQINLLNKKKAYTQKRFWQFINIGIPLLLLALFGFGFRYFRKKKYGN